MTAVALAASSVTVPQTMHRPVEECDGLPQRGHAIDREPSAIIP